MKTKFLTAKIAAILFGPVLLGAVLQALISPMEPILARNLLRIGTLLSMIGMSCSGLFVGCIGLIAIAKRVWPIVDAEKLPLWPHTARRGPVAIGVGSLYVCIGSCLAVSGALIIGLLMARTI